MKSFMRNQRMPLQPGIRTDLRFDALVKKEMQEHEHLISSHNKEMQSLRDELRLALQRCEALSQRHEKDLTDFKEQATSHIYLIKTRMVEREHRSEDQKKAIDSLHDKINSFHESYASKSDVFNFKKDIESKINDTTTSHILSFQQCERAFKEQISVLKNEVDKVRAEIKQNVFDAVEKGEGNFSQARLDKEGIERELIRYKKAMFYIEKKIENIYTLIDRLNKRGETCHKPA